MIVVVILVALIAAVAAGVIVWARGREKSAAPTFAPPRAAGTASCPDCGTRFVAGVDKTCSKCGRDVQGTTMPTLAVRPLPAMDEDDDADGRTVVASSRLLLLARACQSCGAALEGLPVCSKCGMRQG